MKDNDILVLIRHRLNQAEESLKDAKVLLDSNRSPRSIINRSYYAMFYAVLALLQKIGKVPRKHSGVISLFDTEFVLKGFFPKSFLKISTISSTFVRYPTTRQLMLRHAETLKQP